MKIIFLVILLIFSSISDASLYFCKEPSSEPERTVSDKKLNITLHHKASSWLLSPDNKNILRNNKIPFLVYYVIDSEEPFMKYATSYELSMLIKSCLDSELINFAAILNSLYVKENKFFVCKNKKPAWVKIDEIPALEKKLKLKRQELLTGDNTVFNSVFSYRVSFNKSVNIPFSKFPLAHPDFMYDILDAIFNDLRLFPDRKYIPVLHLKSHGSREIVLSGLYECQLNAKIRSQIETMRLLLHEEEINFLEEYDPFLIKRDKLATFEKIISKLGLGPLAQSNETHGQNVSDRNLGNINLGNINLSSTFQVGLSSGLGGVLTSLGANDGLGSDNSFGLDHLTLNTVLDDLFYATSKRRLAFLMLESCDTNRDATFEFKYARNLFGYFSASHSLWYRNIDWWKILRDSKGELSNLIPLIDKESKKILNIQVAD